MIEADAVPPNDCQQSSYYDVMKGNDKGKAATILIELFRQKLDRIQTIGLKEVSAVIFALQLANHSGDFVLVHSVDTTVATQQSKQWNHSTKLQNV